MIPPALEFLVALILFSRDQLLNVLTRYFHSPTSW